MEFNFKITLYSKEEFIIGPPGIDTAGGICWSGFSYSVTCVTLQGADVLLIVLHEPL